MCHGLSCLSRSYCGLNITSPLQPLSADSWLCMCSHGDTSTHAEPHAKLGQLLVDPTESRPKKGCEVTSQKLINFLEQELRDRNWPQIYGWPSSCALSGLQNNTVEKKLSLQSSWQQPPPPPRPPVVGRETWASLEVVVVVQLPAERFWV